MTNNSNDIITRCPSCNTAFKATEAILKIADGTVRCGSCLRVFNAYDHADKEANPQQHTNDIDPASEEDESWALELLRQEEQESDGTEQNTIKPSENKETESAVIDIINNDLQAPETESIDAVEEEATDTNSNNISDQELDEDEADLLDNITLDPLIFREEKKRNKSLLWGSGIVLLSIILVAQVAWIRFDTLSLRKPYRGAYSVACDILQCQLPALSDIKKIRTTQLVVRSHPSQQQALQIDAIILNSASFDQLFPMLRLEFFNLQNETVASRDFHPREYLQGELTGAEVMPAQQPIQLALEIADPGEQAVNYRIVIVKPAS